MERVTEKCFYTKPAGLAGGEHEVDNCLFSSLIPAVHPCCLGST